MTPIFLQTGDGSRYGILFTGRIWRLILAGGLTYEFRTLAKALFTLGGVVQWDAWTEDSRTVLRAINGGQAI